MSATSRPRRVLFVHHDHCTDPGAVAARFSDHGFTVTTLQVIPEEHFEAPGIEVSYPSAEEFDAIVVMGAFWSAYDDDLIGSWLAPEMDLLREADDVGVPVLGICFGGQLLARTHGGRVYRAEEPEIGFIDIASDDPTLALPGRWFAWHYDRWELPPGAVEFARNDLASQGFTLRRNLGVQFHPELTSAVLTGWIDNGGREMLAERGRDADAEIAQAKEWEDRKSVV